MNVCIKCTAAGSVWMNVYIKCTATADSAWMSVCIKHIAAGSVWMSVCIKCTAASRLCMDECVHQVHCYRRLCSLDAASTYHQSFHAIAASCSKQGTTDLLQCAASHIQCPASHTHTCNVQRAIYTHTAHLQQTQPRQGWPGLLAHAPKCSWSPPKQRA